MEARKEAWHVTTYALPFAALFDQGIAVDDNFWPARILAGRGYIERERLARRASMPCHCIPPSIRSSPFDDYATRGRLMIMTARAREMVSRPASHLSSSLPSLYHPARLSTESDPVVRPTEPTTH